MWRGSDAGTMRSEEEIGHGTLKHDCGCTETFGEILMSADSGKKRTMARQGHSGGSLGNSREAIDGIDFQDKRAVLMVSLE